MTTTDKQGPQKDYAPDESGAHQNLQSNIVRILIGWSFPDMQFAGGGGNKIAVTYHWRRLELLPNRTPQFRTTGNLT